MKRLTAFLLLGAILLCGPARLAAETWSGTADFSDAKKPPIKLTVGGGVKFETNFHRFEFGGKTSLAANGTLKNTSGKKLHVALYVAFFDKDKNLIGCGNRLTILDAGKDLVAGNVIEMPAEQMEKIASYQITIYESEKEIGMK
jgi:hypothetical protein